MILSSPYLKYRLERLLIRVFVSFLHRVSTCSWIHRIGAHVECVAHRQLQGRASHAVLV